MARTYLGSVPVSANALVQKQQLDAAAFVITFDDAEPTPLKYGHWWVQPSSGLASLWVPTSTGDLGTWFSPVGLAGDLSDYLKNTTDTFTGTLTMAGHVIPDADVTYDLGSPTKMWRDLYVGPGSIYLNGKKILEDNSDTVTFSTDTDQNLRVETSGSGNIELKATGSGAILAQGTVMVSSGKKILDSAGIKVEFGDDIDVGVNKVTSSAVPSGANDLVNKAFLDSVTVNDATIVRTTGAQTVAGAKTFSNDVVVNGNLTVTGTTTTVNSETIALADNIIELNSNFTTGTPTENSGFLVRRGDLGTVQWIWDEANDRFTAISGGSVLQNIYVGAITATAYNGLTKASVGLPNVDDTSDLAKPISTATASALAGKQASLGYTPVQQGTGVGQTGNIIKIGWSAGSRLKATVDSTDLGNLVFDGHLSNYVHKAGATMTGGLIATYLQSTGTSSFVGTMTAALINASQVVSSTSISASANSGYYISGSFAEGGNIAARGIEINPSWEVCSLQAYHVPGNWAGLRFVVGSSAAVVFEFRNNGVGYSNGWGTHSDIRLKYDLVKVSDALERTRKLTAFTYLRNDFKDVFKQVQPRQLGLIAQDVKKGAPEAVSGDDILSVDYGSISALNTQAINDLHDIVIAQAKEIAYLKDVVANLIGRVDSIVD